MFEAISIVAVALSIRKEEVLAGLDMEIDERTGIRIESLLAERKRGMPFAYLAKRKEFFSEDFYVDGRVLIPRPETEILVEAALGLLKEKPAMASLLDMGTGSGAIGLILAKKTGKHVLCVDISPEAIGVAQRNGETLGISSRVSFVCSDLFAAMSNARFDMIVANLPYVSSEEWGSLMRDVRDHEPRLALDGGQGGVAIYKRFVDGLPHHLVDTGYVLCEIGGREQANTIEGMFRKIGLRTVVKRDLSGNERVVIGSWTGLS